MPEIKVDPFHLRIKSVDDDEASQDIGANVFARLEALSATFPKDGEDPTQSRWATIEDEDRLVVDHLKEYGGNQPRWEGAIMRVKKNELGHVAGPDGTQPLTEKLKEGEGYSHHIAFLWDIKRQVLWLQREKTIVGQSVFADYLRDRVNQSIAMRIVLREDAVERALQMRTIKTFDFGFYTNESEEPEGDLAEFIELAKKYGEVRVDIRISAKRGNTLKTAANRLVKNVANAVKRGKGQSAIRSAEVKGTPDENYTEFSTVDMFHDRNHLTRKLSAERTRDPLKLIATVRSIWSLYRDNIAGPDTPGEG